MKHVYTPSLSEFQKFASVARKAYFDHLFYRSSLRFYLIANDVAPYNNSDYLSLCRKTQGLRAAYFETLEGEIFGFYKAYLEKAA
jgi:hypothetical protein